MDIGSRDYDNWTILYTAILYNHTNISRLLVERCVCTLPKPKGSIVVHLGNQCGELLQYAVFNGNTEILELILNSVVNANAHSLTSMALHTAASEGNVDAIDLLLRSGANPHQVDRNGWSPIICAWKSRRQKGIERLLEAGAVLPDINHLSTKAPTCWSEASNLELLTLSKKNLLIEVLGISATLFRIKKFSLIWLQARIRTKYSVSDLIIVSLQRRLFSIMRLKLLKKDMMSMLWSSFYVHFLGRAFIY